MPLPYLPDGFAILDVDIDRHGRLAIVCAGERGTEVCRNGVRSALVGDAARVDSVRWIGEDLLIWPVGRSTGILKGGDVMPGPHCSPRDVLVADRFMFAAYGEEQFMAGVADGDYAGDRVTVFDMAGARLFGIAELLGRSRLDPDFGEFTRGTATRDGRLIFVADGSPLVWMLSGDRSLMTVRPDRPIDVADEVSAVIVQDGRVGLLTIGNAAVELDWVDLGTGRILGHGRSDAVSLQSGFGPWRARGVEGGAALLHNRRSLVLCTP